MIRKETFALSTETFAAERKQILADTDEALRPHIADALRRLGLSAWQRPIVNQALDVFDRVARAEVDAWNPILDDMHDAFAQELTEALEKTSKVEPDQFEHQVDRITRWISTMAVNAATEAATTSDPDEGVGLEWVSMSDSKVREPHKEAHGQVVPTGQAFEVNGVEMLYPGQPVGDPENWINCRCVAQPTMLDGFTNKTEEFTRINSVFDVPDEVALRLTEKYGAFGHIPTEYVDDVTGTRYRFEGFEEFRNHLANFPAVSLTASAAEKEPITTAVVVAIPAEADPVNAVSSEDTAHATLLYLGEASALDKDALDAAIKEFVVGGEVTPLTEKITGAAIIGKDRARVVLLDAVNLANIRKGLLEKEALAAAYESVDQFATWLPHLTLGYPDAPPIGDEYTEQAITFDRLALWFGEERIEYPFGGSPVAEKEKKVIHPEDPEFTQQMADTFAASVEEEPAPAETEPEETVSEDEEAWKAAQEEDQSPTIPWHGVLAPEGIPSGDGRQFAANALTNRDLPLPLKAMTIDDEGHKGSFIVGRIDRIFREGNLVKGEGVFDSSPEAYEAVRKLAEQMWRGVSVDVDSVEAAVFSEDEEQNGKMVFAKARIASATLCAIPAFAEAYVALGTWADAEPAEAVKSDAAPVEPTAEASSEVEAFEISVPTKTKDGPGWITEPGATKHITGYWVDGRGAAKIGWGAPGDFNRCRTQLAKYVQNPEWLAGLCANLHYRALGAWPGHAAGKVTEMSKESLTASGMTIMEAATSKLSVDYFVNPKLDKPTPFTVTETGHVYGHIATFDTCHIAFKDQCVLAPRSNTDYSYFLTGRVLTDAGPVAVGQITMGGGHADGTLSMSATIAHYDNTTMPVADVTVGEDEFGIWASGKLRNHVTAEEVHELRAAAISGDWRGVVVGGVENLELVAALAVNVPGFPIPNTAFAIEDGRQLSLVAAGIPQVESSVTPEFRTQMEAYKAEQERKEKAETLRGRIRAFKAEEVKKKINASKREF